MITTLDTMKPNLETKEMELHTIYLGVNWKLYRQLTKKDSGLDKIVERCVYEKKQHTTTSKLGRYR